MDELIAAGLLVFRPAFLADSRGLFDRLAAGVAWDDRIRARRVASFGEPYNYSGTVWPRADVPDDLRPVLRAVAAAVGYELNNCPANYYPDGDSTMGYHADAVADLEPGTGISIVSLGAARTLSFRREPDRAVVHEVVLAGGSLLHMTAELQAGRRHAVRRSAEAVGGRISLTFRRLRVIDSPAAGEP